jgi:hypothetical protein
MPWDSLSSFQSSPTFKSNPEMQSWPSFRLSRYIQVFRAVWDMMKSQGASEPEVEASAHALAYTSARRYQPMPQNATLEADVHYFTPLQAHQFSMGGKVEDLNFDYLVANLATISAAVSGNSFNLDHSATEPTGSIRSLVLPKDAPAEVQAKLPPGTPFVIAASYFEGTPELIKATKTISGEWLQTQRADGRNEVVFVDSFCITKEPANDVVLGVGKVAKTDSAEKVEAEASSKIPALPLGNTGKPMTTEQTSGAAALQNAPDAEARFASVSAELDSTKKALKAATLNFAAATNEVATMKKLVEEMKAAAADREAEEAALGLVRDGKATADQTAYFAQMYKDMGRDRFSELASRLQTTTLGAYASKAAAQVPVSEADVKAYKARLAVALARPSLEG